MIQRDLKPENILLDEFLNAKISDFGLSRDLTHTMETYCGTPAFVAPEVIKQESYSEKADVRGQLDKSTSEGANE